MNNDTKQTNIDLANSYQVAFNRVLPSKTNKEGKTMAQVSKFTTGGYVVHKALPDLNVSAWFDKDGNLIDCELITKRGQSRKPAQSTIDMVIRRWGSKQ